METAGDLKKGAVVTCEVTEVKEAGLEVKIVGTDLTAFIKRSELARDRDEQRPERFEVGQKVDARVTQFDRRAHKVQVSIKALEVAEEKEAIAQYGSSDSGATLGDILGTALKRGDGKAGREEGIRTPVRHRLGRGARCRPIRVRCGPRSGMRADVAVSCHNCGRFVRAIDHGGGRRHCPLR